MSQESRVVRNLAVLRTLYEEGPLTLAGIVKFAGYRTGPTERSLIQLQSQGIIEEEARTYRLKAAYNPSISAALLLVEPWLHLQTDLFYEIARSAAEAILNNSYDVAQVQDVLLYGSTLRSDTPRDIDLVIFHSGKKLAEFENSKYAEEGAEPIYDLPAGDSSTTRFDAYRTLKLLGHSEEHGDPAVVRLVGERIKSLDAGSVSEDTVQELLKMRISEQDLGLYQDIHGISEVFDIHVMHTGLLDAGRNLDASVAKMLEEGVSRTEGKARAIAKAQLSYFADLRAQAIESCRDQTFWHRVLSEGRLYDVRTSDFTMTVEEKYPGTLELFIPH